MANNTTTAAPTAPRPLSIGNESPFAVEVDEAFDSATATPPANGWTPAQQAVLDEITVLEGVQNPTPSQQLRLLELKLKFLGMTGKMTPQQLQPYIDKVRDLQTRLNSAMSVSFDDTAKMNELLTDLEQAGVSTINSSLAQKRDALVSNPNLSLESRLRYAAGHQTELASCYSSGSAQHTTHTNRASYLTDVAEKLKYSEGSLGALSIRDLEKITFGDLKALDSDTLQAEADLFRELASKREAELRRTYSEDQGLTPEQVEAKIQQDPLLRYFNGRAGIAEKAANALSGDVSPMDRVRIGMEYFADVAKADNLFYTDMAQLAAANGDDANKARFETMASEASDRLGVINRIAQTLISMLAQVTTEAARG